MASDSLWDISAMANGYTAPKQAGGGTDWLDVARLGLAGLSYLDSRKAPDFKNAPLTPEQRQVWQLYLSSMMNPALKNNAAIANQRNEEVRAGYNNLSWTSPKTFNGQQGYSGSSTPTTPSPIAPTGTGPGGGKPMDQRQHPRTGGANENFQIQHARTPIDDEGSNFPSSPRMPETRGLEYNIGNPAKDFFNSGGTRQDYTTGNNHPAEAMGGTADMEGFANFLASQGVKDAAKVAAGFFFGGLTGGAWAAAKAAYNTFIRGKGGKP